MAFVLSLTGKWLLLIIAFDFYNSITAFVIFIESGDFFIVVPLLIIMARDTVRRECRAQKVIHHSVRVFVEIMRIIFILNYQIEGIEKLEKTSLILANHPALPLAPRTLRIAFRVFLLILDGIANGLVSFLLAYIH